MDDMVKCPECGRWFEVVWANDGLGQPEYWVVGQFEFRNFLRPHKWGLILKIFCIFYSSGITRNDPHKMLICVRLVANN